MTHLICHLLYRGISHVGHLIAMSLIERNFEGENRIHPVDIFLDTLHPILLPRPHLGGDEIMHRNMKPMGIFRQLEVEPRIVHQDQCIRLILTQQTAGTLHI